jgi:hypothetical protein
MATVKLRKLDHSSAGITIPTDELRREGIIVSEPGEEIELAGDHQVYLDRDGKGAWKIQLADRVSIA